MLDKLYKDHRWSNEEIKTLMKMWSDGEIIEVIANALNSTPRAIDKMVTRLRQHGIPLARRTKGHRKGNSNKYWTQAEVEYLVRRRKERATAEEIAGELERTYSAINAMIQKLRKEEVTVERFGQGIRRKWSSVLLNATFNN
jgi:biotin operon repressor